MRWEPFKEIDRFFDTGSFAPALPRPGFDLAVDVYEEKEDVVAKMSLPGVNPEDLDISLEDEFLTVSGRREEERESDGKDYYSKEIRRGFFSRTVSLPRAVDASKARAGYEDGILTVTVPAIAGKKEKAVKVKVRK